MFDENQHGEQENFLHNEEQTIDPAEKKQCNLNDANPHKVVYLISTNAAEWQS